MADEIAFLGLGHMGAPMVANLLNAGKKLVVFDVVPEATQGAVQRGARVAASAAEAVAAAGVVITMLPSGKQVRDVYLGSGGVLAAAREGAKSLGWTVVERPLADGGEGMLDAFGGANRTSTVTGPAGTPVEAPWRLGEDGLAVIESAAASGLALAGGGEKKSFLLRRKRHCPLTSDECRIRCSLEILIYAMNLTVGCGSGSRCGESPCIQFSMGWDLPDESLFPLCLTPCEGGSASSLRR